MGRIAETIRPAYRQQSVAMFVEHPEIAIRLIQPREAIIKTAKIMGIADEVEASYAWETPVARRQASMPSS